jgi:hypothetical protein
MNRPHAIQALRALLKQYGGWDQLHRACVLVDGVLVVKQKALAETRALSVHTGVGAEVALRRPQMLVLHMAGEAQPTYPKSARVRNRVKPWLDHDLGGIQNHLRQVAVLLVPHQCL